MRHAHRHEAAGKHCRRCCRKLTRFGWTVGQQPGLPVLCFGCLRQLVEAGGAMTLGRRERGRRRFLIFTTG